MRSCEVASTSQYGRKNISVALGGARGSELWFRFGMMATAWGATVVSWGNGSATLGSLYLNNLAGVGYFDLYTGPKYMRSTPSILALNNWYLFEFHLYIENSGSGIFTLKVDGAVVANYNPIDTHYGEGDFTVTWIQVQGPATTYFDDLALNDNSGGADNGWCGYGGIARLAPTGPGDLTQLFPFPATGTANWPYVKEVPQDGDATYIWGTGTAQEDLYAAGNVPSNQGILRVWPEGRAKAQQAGSQFALVLRTSGTDRVGPTLSPPTGTYATQLLGAAYTTEPFSGGAWTTGTLQAAQVGAKLI
jgi:hypothetical protein